MSDGTAEIPVEVLVGFAEGVRHNFYFQVAVSCLYFYDHFGTLDEEIRLIWPSRLGFGKIVFFLNRYIPPLGIIGMIYFNLLHKESSSCILGITLMSSFQHIAFIVSQIVLFTRICIIWRTSRLGQLFLLSVFTSYIVLDLVIHVKVLLTVVPAPVRFFRLGCSVTAENYAWISEIGLLAWETTCVVFLLFRAFLHRKETNSKLLYVMYEDGLLYFVIVVVMALVNMITLVAASDTYSSFLLVGQSIGHSMLCTRMLLRMRDAVNVNLVFKRGEHRNSHFGALSHSRATGTGHGGVVGGGTVSESLQPGFGGGIAVTVTTDTDIYKDGGESIAMAPLPSKKWRDGKMRRVGSGESTTAVSDADSKGRSIESNWY